MVSADGPVPDRIGSIVQTDRGVRRLLPVELAKLKGPPPNGVAMWPSFRPKR